MTTCRACGAEVAWFRTAANDKPMPTDLHPTPEGNVQVRDGLAYVLGPLEREAMTDEERGRLRMPHHATCTNWRKR